MMKCIRCEQDLLCTPVAIGDIAVCPECGEILVVDSMAPIRFRYVGPEENVELNGCDNGQKILMYSSLLKAQRRGLSVEPGHC